MDRRRTGSPNIRAPIIIAHAAQHEDTREHHHNHHHHPTPSLLAMTKENRHLSHKEGSVESNTDGPIHRNKKETNTTCGKQASSSSYTDTIKRRHIQPAASPPAGARATAKHICVCPSSSPSGRKTHTPSFPTPTFPSRATQIHSEAPTAVVTRLWARRWPRTCRCHRR
ncbi:unnamed protein product [Ectocarpus sp. 8 AP-2014]